MTPHKHEKESEGRKMNTMEVNIALAVQLYRAGKTVNEISKMLGIHISGIEELCTPSDIVLHNRCIAYKTEHTESPETVFENVKAAAMLLECGRGRIVTGTNGQKYVCVKGIC